MKNKQLVIFAGSGISFKAPSNLPTGKHLKNQILEKMESIYRKSIISFNYIEWEHDKKSHKFLMTETISDHIYYIKEKALKYFDGLDTKIFNFNHLPFQNLFQMV